MNKEKSSFRQDIFDTKVFYISTFIFCTLLCSTGMDLVAHKAVSMDLIDGDEPYRAISSNSYYHEEEILTIESENRISFLTFENSTDQFRAVFYDEHYELWVEVYRSTTQNYIKYHQRTTSGDDFLSSEYFITEEGLYRTGFNSISSSNCSYSAMEITIENVDNGTLRWDAEICPPESSPSGGEFYFSGRPSFSGKNVSLPVLHCWYVQSQVQYRDHLLIFRENGSVVDLTHRNRNGVGGYDDCNRNTRSLATPNSYSTHDMSCIAVRSTMNGGWASRAPGLKLTCYSLENLSQSSLYSFCTDDWGRCPGFKLASFNSTLVVAELDKTSSSATPSPGYWSITNHTITDLSSSWWIDEIQTCTSFSPFGRHGSPYLCDASVIGSNNGSKFFWNPVLNLTEWIPNQLLQNFHLVYKAEAFNSTVFIKSQTNPTGGRIPVLYIDDSDGDGIGIHQDKFPNDSTQQSDSDLDGYGDNLFGTTPDACPFNFGTSTADVFGCLDSDMDGWSNQGDLFPNEITQWNDTDNDGYGDNFSGDRGDACPSVLGSSSRNNTYGCPDADFDGWADFQDHFPYESSQWKDSDGDGYGDEFNGFEGDDCILTAGTSNIDRFGCFDADGDGVSDKNDAFPNNPSQADDRDGDGYGDNQSQNATQIDRFPSDTTQWNDTDGDGYGDNQNGNLPDRFPNDPNRWQDSDHDGVADEDDAFPDDATQDTDSDGDGYGDNAAGNRGDTFPNDPSEWDDTDGDDVGNNEDAFPFDPSQMTDADGDGFGDNPRGTGADKFPQDATQWSDIDGDGYGDNMEGTTPDAFIADPTQWSDVDGDGYGDNPTGRLADAFRNDPT